MTLGALLPIGMLSPPANMDAFFLPLARELGVRHNLADTVSLFSLSLARWAPIVALAPFLGGRLVPAPIKMGLSILLALFTLPALSAAAPLPLAYSSLHWWTLLFKELFVGFCLGFAASLLFWSAEMGGKFLDNVRGTTSANLMIPQVQVQSSLLGDFYFQLFVVLFVFAGGHLVFLSAVFQSYSLVPPLSLGLGLEATANGFLVATGDLFVVTLKLIAPALMVLMLMDLMLGVANRMAPQLDVFFISLSLKSSVGAFVIALSLYYLLSLTPELFDHQHRLLYDSLKNLAAAPV